MDAVSGAKRSAAAAGLGNEGEPSAKAPRMDVDADVRLGGAEAPTAPAAEDPRIAQLRSQLSLIEKERGWLELGEWAGPPGRRMDRGRRSSARLHISPVARALPAAQHAATPCPVHACFSATCRRARAVRGAVRRL